MTKINQIQNALLELEGGAFQKLADSYLLKKGYQQINPIGSVIGKNKVRKGTPDTLIPTAEGKYNLVEHTTTQEKDIFQKFSEDIDKCLDEKKTGLPIKKISEIILCHTSELLGFQIDELREKCQNAGINLNIYGISSISYDLREKYPGIAKDYLGIEIDTGQILALEDFISLYEKNKLTTTLRTSFYFREEEKKYFHELIENNSIIVISGMAGVGKTRFAIECFKDYLRKNNDFKSYCIFNHGLELFDDLRVYFSDSGDYLIFVDDANRINGFEYLLQLFQRKRNNQNFKIIVTVRDYALDKIREFCKSLDSATEINLKKLNDDEIKTFIKKEFNINNHIYLDRIIDIAQGNPRIAVMAAKIVNEEHTLESIYDVSALYDIYYSTIKSDLRALNDINALKVAGIISFLRIVDKTNKETLSRIHDSFDISAEDFWKQAKILHNAEIINMFENECVKISDQVLGTYIFYLVFFKEEILDFYKLIIDFFPAFEESMKDAINPVLNIFHLEKTKSMMLPAVDKAWKYIQEKAPQNFIKFMNIFYFLKPTETLLFIHDQVENAPKDHVDLDKIKFKSDSKGISLFPAFMPTLPLFRFFGESELNLSLDIFLRYAEKNPNSTSGILYYLVETYGFNEYSYSTAYNVQFAVVNKIIHNSNSGENEYFSRLFIELAKNYLHTHFDHARFDRGGRTMTLMQFDLSDSKELFDLRNLIWNNLFSFYRIKNFREHILELMIHYSQAEFNITSVDSIVKQESGAILVFIEKNFNPENLYHCIVTQKYLKKLNRFDISYSKALKELFNSNTYKLFDLITNHFDRAEVKLKGAEYSKYKKGKIRKFTNKFSVDNYKDFFRELFLIYQELGGHSKWLIDNGILSILEELSERDPKNYPEVINNYLIAGEPLNLSPYFPVCILIKTSSPSYAFKILTTANYPSKNRWLFSYYQHLPEGNIKRKDLLDLEELFSKSEQEHLIHDLDFLFKYENIENGFILKIIQIVLNRSKSKPEFAFNLCHIFYKHTAIYKQLSSLFLDNMALLENVYIAINSVESCHDYDGKVFSFLLDNNPMFMGKYIKNSYSKKDYLTKHDDARDYSFIWQRDDYIKILNIISSSIINLKEEWHHWGYFETFFTKATHPQTDVEIIKRQDLFLGKEITEKSQDKNYMKFIFNVIIDLDDYTRIFKFYQSFLKANQKFDDFYNLPLEPILSSWNGSEVPILQERINFFEQIISICDTVQLLKHRHYMENEIKRLRMHIIEAKKRDFARNL